MTSLWAFLFVLGVLIFVHELGHFIMARRVGVRVLTFSLGFGPKLVRFRRGDTEYCISAIPLGGYVRMAGDSPDQAHAGRDDEFLSKTKWQRFQVLIMGPLMNLLLAVVVLAVVFYRGAEVPAFEQQAPVVGRVAEGSPAAAAGLGPGDLIVSVGGRPVGTWEQVQVEILPRAGRETDITVVRDGREVALRVTPEPQTRYEIGDIGVQPVIRPQLQAVSPGEPAARAGLRPGDLIVAVNGDRAITHEILIDRIKESEGTPITLTVRRDGEERDVAVTPERRGDIAMIGVHITPELRTIDPGALGAVRMSVAQNYQWSTLIFRTLWGLITGNTPLRQLMGPVAIAELSGGAAQAGWVSLFTLMAMISLNLGLLNLLPIPVLDGGHIAIMALEGLARRDFSIRVKEKMLVAGFVALVLLMATVIYNDLTRVRWIENFMFWR